MAREITGVGELLPNGRTTVTMLYVFPVVPRIVNGQGVDVIPAFDPADIPERFAGRLLPPQLAAMSNGDAGFIVTTLDKSAGESDAQFAVRVKIDYDALWAYELQQARDRAIEANQFNLRRFQLSR